MAQSSAAEPVTPLEEQQQRTALAAMARVLGPPPPPLPSRREEFTLYPILVNGVVYSSYCPIQEHMDVDRAPL